MIDIKLREDCAKKVFTEDDFKEPFITKSGDNLYLNCKDEVYHSIDLKEGSVIESSTLEEFNSKTDINEYKVDIEIREV